MDIAALEFPPLLPPGLHALTPDGLQALCVTPFGASQTRPVIMANLLQVRDRIIQVDLPCELWIDGSFLTEKTDPADVDIALRVEAAFYESASPEQLEVITWVQSNLKQSHMCDSYVFHEWAPDHQHHATGQWMRAYWIRQFGFSRNEEMKGIAVFSPGA